MRKFHDSLVNNSDPPPKKVLPRSLKWAITSGRKKTLLIYIFEGNIIRLEENDQNIEFT